MDESHDDENDESLHRALGSAFSGVGSAILQSTFLTDSQAAGTNDDSGFSICNDMQEGLEMEPPEEDDDVEDEGLVQFVDHSQPQQFLPFRSQQQQQPNQPYFLAPKPKVRPSSSRQFDSAVGSAIDRLVFDRVSDSTDRNRSFLNSMNLQNTFSLDSIWKPPTLPHYGRLEAVRGMVSERPVTEAAAPISLTDFKRKRLLATALAKSDDQLLMSSMRKLREIVLYNPSDSRLGLALMDISGKLVPESVIATSFSDSVAGKSPGTIAKRVSDYHRFSRWAVDRGRCSPMGISERVLYEYAQFLTTSGAAPTSLQSLLKAIGFMEHHIGFATVDISTIISGRVSGVSKNMLSNKRELKQAPPLTADGLYMLERYVCQAGSRDACIGGFFVFCLLASARFADAARARTVSIESCQHISIVESSTMKFKTAHTAGREVKNLALPMLALGAGLYDQYWCKAWIEAREIQQMDRFDMVMPAWSDITNTWINRPMTSGEGVYFLREILCSAGMSEQQASTYTTHTLKATALSWAATSGAMTVDERRIMGRHFDSRLAMPLVYSRDALAQIQTKLWRLLGAIRRGQFDPDSTRAARIAAETLQRTGLTEEDFGSDESVGPEDLEPVAILPIPDRPKEADRQSITMEQFNRCVQHTFSGVLHIALSDDEFACSRRVSKNFKKPSFGFADAMNFPFCIQCASHG